MKASSEFFKRVVACELVLLSIGISGLTVLPAPGAPIEFSEPTGSNPAASVSDLGAKRAELPALEDRIFKPHNYMSDGDVTYTPSLAAPAAPFRQNPVPGQFDREKNWLQFTPAQAWQKMIDRDGLKPPSFEKNGNDFSDTSFGKQPASRRNAVVKNERFQDARHPENTSDSLASNDPFAAYSRRAANFGGLPSSELNEDRPRNLSDLTHPGNDVSPEAMRQQKEITDHLEEFRRTLTPQTTMIVNPAIPVQAPENAYVTHVENPSRGPNGRINPMFLAPVVPVAPQAPQAPGQPSLAPSTYTSSAKLKPVIVTAPRRSF